MLDQSRQENIKKFIDLALGVPWLDRGRDMSGWDCWGLVLLAYRQCFGLALPDLAAVSALDAAQVNGLFCGCRRAWREIPQGHERPGDVALFRRGRWVCHAGVVIARGFLLHIEPGIDTCVEPFYRGQLQTRLAGIYRHEKL